MIKIIGVGTIKEQYLKEAINEYVKRLKKFTTIEIIEVKDEGFVEKEKAMSLEEGKILKHIHEKDYIITLEIEGKELDSVEFANKIDKIQQEHSNITFIIGGSYGLSNNIKAKANFSLSFSKMTFPHQLFRVLLLEQIYRAFKISKGETYHW